ncbi:right-handed parallel beta-helix repeat-containing protein [Saccharicrinis sp. 156]|uniref:right-handed parallel beta-helix repeat-containing protein n=1 Tax=Saccharicrinis sp. 156 TaxID=3417574 RepID=UPI003D3565E1
MKKLLLSIYTLLMITFICKGESFGSGTETYSTVQSADKPIVYSTAYYPSSNDALGIQNAIDAANTNGGGTIYLSSITYNIDTPIHLKSNVRISGKGIGQTILKRSSAFTTSTGYFIGADNASLTDVEIRELSIEGGYTANELINDLPDVIGLGVWSDTEYYNQRIRTWEVEISGFTMGIHIKGTTHIRLEYSNIHDNGGHYLYHNIYFRRAGQALIYNCKIYNAIEGSGLKLAGGTTTVTNESRYFTIKDNEIFDNERINLNIQGCHHILISGNDLIGQKSTTSKMAGLYMVEYNGYECRYTDIINNKVIDNTNNGMYINACRTFNVEGNKCVDNGTNYNVLNCSDFECDYNEDN